MLGFNALPDYQVEPDFSDVCYAYCWLGLRFSDSCCDDNRFVLYFKGVLREYYWLELHFNDVPCDDG